MNVEIVTGNGRAIVTEGKTTVISVARKDGVITVSPYTVEYACDEFVVLKGDESCKKVSCSNLNRLSDGRVLVVGKTNPVIFGLEVITNGFVNCVYHKEYFEDEECEDFSYEYFCNGCKYGISKLLMKIRDYATYSYDHLTYSKIAELAEDIFQEE